MKKAICVFVCMFIVSCFAGEGSASLAWKPIKKLIKKSPSFSQIFLMFSARVFTVDETLTPNPVIVQLANLKGDGTLQGTRVRVVNHCADKPFDGNVPIVNVNSPSNVFVYNPVSNKFKFDQVNVYYAVESALDFFSRHAGHIGWAREENGQQVLQVPIYTVVLCHPDYGPVSTGEYKGGTVQGTTIMLGCYDQITCSSIGKQLNQPMENRSRSLGTIIHEMNHSIYVPTAERTGIQNARVGQWNQLNEAYANFIARAGINALRGITSSQAEIGDLTNNNNFTTNNYDNLNENNILAIAGAFWDVGVCMGLGETAELIFRSWNCLYSFKDRSSPVAALISLVDASKRKNGADSTVHRNNRAIIEGAFGDHGIVCTDCVPGSLPAGVETWEDLCINQ